VSEAVDLLLLSLGTTRGLRIADGQFARMARSAGASVAVAGTRIGLTDKLRRGYPVNDIVEAIAARRALDQALRTHHPRALVLSSTTAALLVDMARLPAAVWLDSPARLNRPGARNAILHPIERRQLARARMLLVLSEPAVAELPKGHAPAVVIPPPIDASSVADGAREPIVVAYTPDPKARDLELVCRAWTETAAGEARLIVTGIEPERARAFLRRRGLELPARAELAGMLDRQRFRELLGKARVFLGAARWEDFGITPLEALDRGAVLVLAPGGGPFPALAIARELDPRFVASDRSPAAVARSLESALATGDAELAAYRGAAMGQLEPFREPAIVARLRDEVLPLLLDAT
jgi:hypothetical protein